MELYPQPLLLTSDATANSTQPASLDPMRQVKGLGDFHSDSQWSASRPSPFHDVRLFKDFFHIRHILTIFRGSKRCSHRAQQHSSARLYSCQIHWLPPGDENNVQRRRTESPFPSRSQRFPGKLIQGYYISLSQCTYFSPNSIWYQLDAWRIRLCFLLVLMFSSMPMLLVMAP